MLTLKEYEDQYVYSLEFPSVTEEFFRTYTFHGKNRLGEVEGDATLKLGELLEYHSEIHIRSLASYNSYFYVTLQKIQLDYFLAIGLKVEFSHTTLWLWWTNFE